MSGKVRSTEPRLLIYSQDGLGLGHLRRTSLLAAEFLAAQPGASVLTISDSPAGEFFSTAPGHDYLKLPSIRKVRPRVWTPLELSLPFDEVQALRTDVIRTAALSFKPDVLLVDHMPHGAMGELFPTLEALEGSPVRMVLGLRDILDAPVTVSRVWQEEGAFDAVERHFHDVLVYGSRDVFDVAAEYAWPPELSTRLRYCGYVCAPPSSSPVEPVRRRFLGDVPGGELVVAMAGGGADAQPLFDVLLSAVPELVSDRRIVVVIVTGPFLRKADRDELERKARGLPVHLIQTVDDSLNYLGAADLIVGMAGYNTTAEVLSLANRALLVPRAGPSAEQQMRASRFAERGWIRWLPAPSLSPKALADEMVRALDTPPAPPSVAPDLRGRERAAAHLLAGLNGHAAAGRRVSLVPAAANDEPVGESAQLVGQG